MQKIINEIHAYILRIGGHQSNWYVGIANDPRDRLFNGHGVGEHGGVWIHINAGTETIARAVEKSFLDWGCAGGGGGGDANTCYVYAYQITPRTRE